MRLPACLWVTTLVVLVVPYTAMADSSTSEDRISMSGSGSTLTHTDGGYGGALGWLHNFNPDTLLSVGGEHQKLGVADWSFASLAGAWSHEIGDGRYTFAGEAHEGAGDDGPHPLKYHIEAASVTGTYFHQLSVQVEDRRIDVETTHGNLPKVGVSYLWTRHWLTSISYAKSISGNLDTTLTNLRIDHYSPVVNLLAGGSYGRTSAQVLALGIIAPGTILHEGYIGASKTFARRTDVNLTFDYLDLSGSKRATLTLGAIIKLGSLGARH